MLKLPSITKTKKEEPLFRKEAYIPKKKLLKKTRGITHPGLHTRGSGASLPSRNPFRKILMILLWICFVGEVGYSLFFADFFVVERVDIEQSGDTQNLSQDSIRQYLEDSWQGKWYGFLPKDNLLLVNSSFQESRLLERFPKIKELKVERHFPNSLSVKIVEKSYQVLWCSKKDCFLVDAEGKALSADRIFQYPEEQGRIIRIQDGAEQAVSPEMKVLEREDTEFIDAFVRDFTLRTGLQWDGNMERPTLYAREMRVRVDPGFSLFLNTREPLEESLNNLMLVLQKEIPESEWDKIDYIDLRTENRVYYTRKDRAPEKTEEQIKREEEEEKKREEEQKQKEQGR